MSPGLQRCVVAAAIIGVHVLGAWLLLAARHLVRPDRPHAPDSRLVYVAALAPPVPSSASAGTLHSRPSTAAAAGVPSAITGPPLPIGAATSQTHIDWDLEAEVAADDLVAELARHERRKCDDSGKPGSWLPKCRKHAPSFEWSEEPKRAGFANGLPYLRLGRHCILVLGIVGCALGPLPRANAHLFDDLRDPDRERSSVPDIGEINDPADAAPRHPSVLRADPR